MNKKLIQCGDIVTVYFSGYEPLYCVEVISQPQDVGDHWSLYDKKTNTPHNIQSFRDMVLVKRKGE